MSTSLNFVNQDRTDFSILSKFPLLNELTISGCDCRDVHFLSSVKTLRRLNLSYNNLTDISPLITLHHLEHLDVHHTPIVEAQELIERGCNVVITLEDVSLERFKWELSQIPYKATLVLGFKQRSEDFEGFVLQAKKYKTRLDRYHEQARTMRNHSVLVLTKAKKHLKKHDGVTTCSKDYLSDIIQIIFENDCERHEDIKGWLHSAFID